MGYPGALEGAMKFVTNPNLVSRIHFAKWLVDTKAASSIDSAFEKFIGSGRPGFVSLKAPTISQAVHLIKEGTRNSGIGTSRPLWLKRLETSGTAG